MKLEFLKPVKVARIEIDIAHKQVRMCNKDGNIELETPLSPGLFETIIKGLHKAKILHSLDGKEAK